MGGTSNQSSRFSISGGASPARLSTAVSDFATNNSLHNTATLYQKNERLNNNTPLRAVASTSIATAMYPQIKKCNSDFGKVYFIFAINKIKKVFFCIYKKIIFLFVNSIF